MRMKGISPLIAAVLLIAFTLAIAGIIATWATTYVREKAAVTLAEAECIGALEAESPSFSGTNITINVKDVSTKLNLTDIRLFLEYDDVTKNKQLSSGISLAPGDKRTISLDTADTTKPKSVEVSAANCPKYPTKVTLR